ncbi:hypothetical protein C2W64_00698 [Brevibacillus laterosporus]|nr:hypothetical protein C2W64_00698 [Brevibacillus laterosporus]
MEDTTTKLCNKVIFLGLGSVRRLTIPSLFLTRGIGKVQLIDYNK